MYIKKNNFQLFETAEQWKETWQKQLMTARLLLLLKQPLQPLELIPQLKLLQLQCKHQIQQHQMQNVIKKY